MHDMTEWVNETIIHDKLGHHRSKELLLLHDGVQNTTHCPTYTWQTKAKLGNENCAKWFIITL